jgi:hypothetical protein
VLSSKYRLRWERCGIEVEVEVEVEIEVDASAALLSTAGTVLLVVLALVQSCTDTA